MEYFINNMKNDGFEVVHAYTTRHLIHAARNHFLQRAKEENFDYVMFIDDDNPPNQLDAIPRLYKVMQETKAKVVTGLVRLRNDTKKLNIYKKKYDHKK
jgi:Asp-tRNA(Asn)/Glu-tRNA(Gln) amidotransferase B subunit